MIEHDQFSLQEKLNNWPILTWLSTTNKWNMSNCPRIHLCAWPSGFTCRIYILEFIHSIHSFTPSSFSHLSHPIEARCDIVCEVERLHTISHLSYWSCLPLYSRVIAVISFLLISVKSVSICLHQPFNLPSLAWFSNFEILKTNTENQILKFQYWIPLMRTSIQFQTHYRLTHILKQKSSSSLYFHIVQTKTICHQISAIFTLIQVKQCWITALWTFIAIKSSPSLRVSLYRGDAFCAVNDLSVMTTLTFVNFCKNKCWQTNWCITNYTYHISKYLYN